MDPERSAELAAIGERLKAIPPGEADAHAEELSRLLARIDELHQPTLEETAEAVPLPERKLPGGLPPTPAAARWIGNQAGILNRSVAARKDLPTDYTLIKAFDEGVAAAEDGSRLSRPDEVTDIDARRLRRLLMADRETRDKPVPFDVQIVKLVRHPVAGRATFDLTVARDGREATLTRLDGGALSNYRTIHDLAIEARVALPPVLGKTKLAWDALLAAAIGTAEDAPMDAEESVILAIRQEIVALLLQAEMGETEADLRRGAVLRVDGQVYVLPQIVISRVRSRLADDKPGREQIIDAARMLGMTSSRPHVGDRRPRVWAFAQEKLR